MGIEEQLEIEERLASLRGELAREREARARAEAGLQRLREVPLLGVCVCDLQGRVLEANEAFLRLLGSSRDGLRARSIDLLELSPPELRERAEKGRHHLVKHGTLDAGEFTLLRPDGGRVPVLMSGSRAGESLILFAQDLSESRRKDLALRSAEARIALLLEAVPALLAEVAADGTVHALAGTAHLGLTKTDGAARIENWARRPELVQLRERALAGERSTTRIEWSGRLFDLTLAPLDPTLATRDLAPAPHDLSGAQHQRSLLAAAVEVTQAVRAVEERQRLQDWLAQSHQLDGLGALAAGLANTFNNLLAGVLANASAARQALVQPSVHAAGPQLAPLDDLLVSASRAADLARQLLQTAAPAATPGDALDLARQLTELEPLLRAGISRRASLKLELAEALPRVRTSPEQLRRALVPLMTAALEATRDRGTLTLRTRLAEAGGPEPRFAGGDRLERGWYASVTLEDGGEPLDEPALAKLRDPLASPDPGPRALGLAAVLSSMRAARGAMRVESDAARGTSVELLFPLSETPPARPLEAPRGSAPSRQILVVDDDPIILRAAARILERLGLPVSLASSGPDAISQLRAGLTPGVVLLDFAMPGMNGEQTLRALREVQPDLRALICSGYGEEEATWGLSCGFLAKPFTAETMQAAVLAALG